ncbi:hypothetical protein BJD16_20750 [Aeromonas sobria]|uniref:Uncharacterized protein n=1 Tax=Aeromonas sobria TaxID=646 RepID=A0A1S2CKN1_AERSO|nr:hypothetical protein BJD16_20750 [Aeromonas sobria]
MWLQNILSFIFMELTQIICIMHNRLRFIIGKHSIEVKCNSQIIIVFINDCRFHHMTCRIA